eukprot:PLAT12896.1.p2 GENE.PLAT12896.1~~PLAT12896.1.p2  ORF type:complete len:157 (+),score=50.48 PLAT12896.1:245-715(+)
MTRLQLGKLTDETIVPIVEAMARDPVVERLALKKCTFGEVGVTALAAMLASNNALQHLDLQSSGVDDTCVEALLEGLLRNDKLVRLDLSGCQLTDAGAGRLVDGLSSNTALTKLILLRNCIDHELPLLERAREGLQVTAAVKGRTMPREKDRCVLM